MARYQCNTCGAVAEQEQTAAECCPHCASRNVVNLALQAAETAKANDAFRTQAPLGGHPVYQGRVVATRGVSAEGPEFVTRALLETAAFKDFTEDNDPYGDHSMGAVQVCGKAVWWKIDLYDADYRYGADDPLDDKNTRRVLTLHFPSEY